MKSTWIRAATIFVASMVAGTASAQEMRCDYDKDIMCNNTGSCAELPNSFYAVFDQKNGTYWRCDLEGSEPDGCYTLKASFEDVGGVVFINVTSDKPGERILARVGQKGAVFMESIVEQAYTFQSFGSCKAR